MKAVQNGAGNWELQRFDVNRERLQGPGRKVLDGLTASPIQSRLDAVCPMIQCGNNQPGVTRPEHSPGEWCSNRPESTTRGVAQAGDMMRRSRMTAGSAVNSVLIKNSLR